MADLEDFYPYILPDVVGCPEPAVDNAIIRAARDLCTHGKAWQAELDWIPVVDSLAEYELALPVGAALVVLEWVKWNGVKLGVAHSLADIDTTQVGPPTRYAQPDLVNIVLLPTPASLPASSVLTLHATLKPSATASQLPDVLFDEHVESIAAGARAILKRQPGKEWSDPKGALDDDAAFQRAKGEARVCAEHGNVLGSLRVKPRRFC